MSLPFRNVHKKIPVLVEKCAMLLNSRNYKSVEIQVHKRPKKLYLFKFCYGALYTK